MSNKGSKDVNYAIVIDAGSGGTRLKVYEWSVTSQNDRSGLPNIKLATKQDKPGELCIIRVQGGLSKMNSPAEVYKYCTNLLAEAKEFIPLHKHGATMLYLKGTGGLRLISKDTSDWILKTIKEVFKESGFMYEEESSVTIMPGKVEGFLSWINVNYLAGNFSDATTTWGLLELGGASLQVALALEPSMANKNALSQLELNNQVYSVYSECFETWGSGEALRRYQKTLDQDPITGQLLDPGFCRGYVGRTRDGLEFIGSGDFTSCLNKLSALALADRSQYKETNTEEGIASLIPHDMILMGVGGFYTTFKWFGCSSRSSTLNWLHDKASHVCSTFNIQQYEAMHPEEDMLNEHNYGYCFYAAYIITTLHTIFGIALDRHVIFNGLPNSDVSWTLGAIIYELNKTNTSKQIPNS